jgi:hypothetical protein
MNPFLRWSAGVLVAVTVVAAQDPFELDEDALFGDTATVVESATFTDSATVVDETKSRSVSFGGAVSGSMGGGLHRTYFDEPRLDRSSYGAAIYGDFNLDVRLPGSVKSYANAVLAYSAVNDSLTLQLNELFLDWNLNYRIFFRGGKQILQWGRGYFFNPVDLVNVEKKALVDELDGREGAFGLRIHVPYGTVANVYSFIDMGGVPRADSLALALKAEFLVKSVEFALSAWGRSKTDPVYGVDFSTSLGSLMLSGELALHQSLLTYDLGDDEDSLIIIERKKWVPRLSLGAGHYFDFGDINDRILLQLEGYYNQAGSERSDLVPAGMSGRQAQDAFSQLSPDVVGSVFVPNSVSRWYLAGFATVSRFIVTEMTLSASGLANLNQSSGVLSVGLNYTTLHNLSFDAIVTAFPGRSYTEYNIYGQGFNAELRAGIRF